MGWTCYYFSGNCYDVGGGVFYVFDFEGVKQGVPVVSVETRALPPVERAKQRRRHAGLTPEPHQLTTEE